MTMHTFNPVLSRQPDLHSKFKDRLCRGTLSPCVLLCPVPHPVLWCLSLFSSHAPNPHPLSSCKQETSKQNVWRMRDGSVLSTHAALAEDLSFILRIHMVSHNHLTPVVGDLTTSSNLGGHQTHVQCTYIHVCWQSIHTHK